MERLHVQIGCYLALEHNYPTPLQFLIQPETQEQQVVVRQEQKITPNIPSEQIRDLFGNRYWRMLAPSGPLEVYYNAIVELAHQADPVLPHLEKTPIEQLPGDVVSYLWPSRHCQSDLLANQAWQLFGDIQGGWRQAQAVCDWLHQNIEYRAGSSSITSSVEILEQGAGVCRDFAHLGISFCRALNMPARYVSGYLGDIDVEPVPIPMDFHAWFEVFLDGAWRTFDARHNIPRVGRVVVATGRDAVDCAWLTSFGQSNITELRVWADQIASVQANNDNAIERPLKV